MKTIVDRYDKQDMMDLPRVLFPGKIEVVVSEHDAVRAVKFLLKQPLLGFDTETRPSFVKGRLYKVALLQVCSGELCFLFRLNRIGLPECLVKLLEDRRITKVALSWHDDLHSLLGRKEFKPGTFIDLQNVANQMGIQDGSLQKLYANIFGQKISKGQQLSNWEADSLTEAQQLYAATDAWACVQLYKEMMRMQEEGYELEVKSEE
ncbi:MAG: 3'-5' exonuclease domain-containing protein 2 [Bacteroidaceae bacterium]|nr:3'-5' exonuclease domain-containing protein 2 [Bacteroidaceae bacterium]